MTSLSEVYGERGRNGASLRRLYLGVTLFSGGILLVLAGIVSAGTGLLVSMEGVSLGDARLYGGILGGTGVPLVMLGVMSVLPASRNTRAVAVVGAAVMGLGVALFAHAYPHHWIGGPSPELRDLTLVTASVYFLGAATTFWCLFVGIANFKQRNDPGGTVTMEVTHKGETKIVEVDRGQLQGVGGIGFFGGTPDGDVATQTNSPNSGAGVTHDGASVSDGGSDGGPLSSPEGSPERPSDRAAGSDGGPAPADVEDLGPKTSGSGDGDGDAGRDAEIID